MTVYSGRSAGDAYYTRLATRVLNELTAEALAHGRGLDRLEVRRPTLEEVYLSLVEEAE